MKIAFALIAIVVALVLVNPLGTDTTQLLAATLRGIITIYLTLR
jgi:hypothetical protein